MFWLAHNRFLQPTDLLWRQELASMYKRRDWIHLHGQQAAEAGSDDSQSDDSQGDPQGGASLLAGARYNPMVDCTRWHDIVWTCPVMCTLPTFLANYRFRRG